METSFNHSCSKIILPESKFLLTSINTRKKILLHDPINFNPLTPNKHSNDKNKILDTKINLPNISNNLARLTTNSNIYLNSPIHNKLNLKKIQCFIHPSLESLSEKDKINDLKKKLEKKRFNQLHNYKLKINPNNIFHDYGLSNYIKINSPLRFYNKSTDRYFNNISSYNYTKTEEKKSEINSSTAYNLKMRINNMMKSLRLKNIPSKDTSKLNNFLFENFSVNKKKTVY